MKTAFTFGSNQLPRLRMNPMDVILVIEADTEQEARQIVFDSFIGDKFCTSYPEKYIAEFESEYNMKQYTLEELSCKMS